MLNDKPLRAADSRTARQTISQAAKIGRQQAAVSICLCHEQNMLSNKPSTMNTLRRELYAKQLAIRQANDAISSKKTMSNAMSKTTS